MPLPLLAAGTTGSSNNTRPILVPRSVGKSWKITSSTTCFIPRRLIATTRTLRQNPTWKWSKEPDVRKAVRPQVAELARVATFLASEGITLNNEAYVLFVDAVQDNFYLAVSLLKSRAEGDYSKDVTPDSFPEFTERPTRGEGVSYWELFEGYVTATRRAPKTVSRWRAVFLRMQKDFADTTAEGITEDLARSWIAGLVTE